MNFESELNPSQLAAVKYCDGPQLIIAGAGSGKTRVLTYKIAYLLEQGLKPWTIMALTFTNKAAREMKERIAALVDDDSAAGLRMGTFHSIFARILRTYAANIGFTSDFTIYDETDSRSLIKKIVREAGLDEKMYKPSTVHSVISREKNRLCSAADYVADPERTVVDQHRQMPELGAIYAAYEQRLRQANCMDFDDLLVHTFHLLAQHADVRDRLQERYEYVLVDEYQDTNYVQRRILELLTGSRHKLCVVGDDFQSIYAFRGANIDNILSFEQVFGGAKLFKLEQNYRSTKLIVEAANSLMTHNTRQIAKQLFSENEDGEPIAVREVGSDRDEARMVCREIKRIRREEDCQWSDFAVLYRTNAQSRTLEEEMRQPEQALGDHYRVYGGLSFYQRKEIKDVVAYFRLVANPRDEEAFARVVNYPARGIGATTMQRLAGTMAEHGVSAWDVLGAPAQYPLAINKGAMTKLIAFRDLIAGFIAQRDKLDALTLGSMIIEQSGIKAELLTDRTPEGDARRENVDSLVSGIANFVDDQQQNGDGRTSLTDYLSTVSLMTDDESGDDSDDKIALMTIHAAKGLEFHTVFIVGVEENILPSPMSVDNARAVDEERRLLYVAITRAEKHCYLSWAHRRWRFGKQDMYVQPSRFLRDIDTQYTSVKAEAPSMPVRHNRGLEDGWNDGYESDRPYTGSHPWGQEYRKLSGRMQNSRPVAGQFMADPKPKVTAPRQPEQAVNPFSDAMVERLKQSGRWRKVSEAMGNGGRTVSTGAPRPTANSSTGGAQNSARQPITPKKSTDGGASSAASQYGIKPGDIVEHARFGRGTVVNVEGTGENCKAKISFVNNGEKQLLLKFARLTVVG